MDTELVRQLRRNLTLHFVIIAFMTALLIATASGGYYLPAMVFVVGVVALLFVDTLGWFEMGRIASYIGMSLVTCFAVGSYVYSVWVLESEAGQLIAVAGLLVYPECVLFLQRKSLRVFEQLAIFLLLEMIVAAIINDDLFFGLLLTPIILLWVSSLFLFSRYATLVQVAPDIDEPIPILVELMYRRFVKPLIRESKRNKTVSTRLLPSQEIQATKPAWRLLQTLPLGVGALAFAAMFFYLLPRTSPGVFHAGIGVQPRIGLPTELTMGMFGRLLQDPTPVMRVTLRSQRTGEPYPVKEPPYLRARVFDTYSPQTQQGNRRFSSRWMHSISQPYSPRLGSATLSGYFENEKQDLVSVEFDIRREFVSVLYTIPPTYAVENQGKIELSYDPYNLLFDQVDPNSLNIGKSLVYNIGSAGFKDNRQLPIYPAHFPRASAEQKFVHLMQPIGSFPQADAERLELLKREGIPETDKFAAANAYERYFVYSGKFRYTLDLRPPMDSDMDPIEDFIVNQPEGHCQYFAAAMVALLRQNQIPSRIVVGFRPTEYNNFGYFPVKQSDAHAWVEALFTRDQLANTEYAQWLSDKHTLYWVRFDPTPASDGGPVEIVEQRGQAIDYAEKLWKDYVVDARKLKSGNGIYDPGASGDTNAYAGFIANLQELKRKLENGTLWNSSSGIGFSWTLAIGITILGVLGIAIWQLLVNLPRWAPQLAKRLGMDRSRKVLVKQVFYARLLEILARRGIVREPSLTMQEFTKDAGVQHESSAVSPALQLLTDFYYRVRFGGDQDELTDEETTQIKQALSLVEVNNKRTSP